MINFIINEPQYDKIFVTKCIPLYTFSILADGCAMSVNNVCRRRVVIPTARADN